MNDKTTCCARSRTGWIVAKIAKTLQSIIGSVAIWLFKALAITLTWMAINLRAIAIAVAGWVFLVLREWIITARKKND